MHVTIPRRVGAIAAALSMAVLLAGSTAYAGQRDSSDDHGDGADPEGPLIFGHRGAAGYRPEHTLAVYELADPDGRRLHRARPGLDQGRRARRPPRERDRRHDRRRDHPEFADRKPPRRSTASRSPAGSPRTSRSPSSRRCAPRSACPQVRPEQHRLRRPLPGPDLPGGHRPAPSGSRKLHGRPIGIYPETKHPTYFDSIGLSLEEPLSDAAPQRPRQPRARGLRAVVRGRRTCVSCATGSSRCRWCSSSARPGRRTTSSRPATRDLRRHGHPGRPGEVATLRRRARAGQGRRSSRATRPATPRRRRRSWPTRTVPA